MAADGSASPYWDHKLETQGRAEWDALTLWLLQRHLRHAYDGSAYYRAAFDRAGAHPDQLRSLDDLRRFPLIDIRRFRPFCPSSWPVTAKRCERTMADAARHSRAVACGWGSKRLDRELREAA